MGNASFAAATPALKDPFTPDELRRLRIRFSKLDLDHSRGLSAEEFAKIPGIAENPLVHRIIQIFDADKNGVVDFQEFMTGMGVFSMKSDISQKLKFAFQVYDIDQDGYISNGELFQVLKVMVEDSLTDIQLQQLVDKTIVYFDHDNDGKLSFDEFAEALRKMTKLIDVSKQMSFAV